MVRLQTLGELRLEGASDSALSSRRAVSRWKGRFLPGAAEVGGDALRAWLEAEREPPRGYPFEAFLRPAE
jgi:hypothetical protein